MKKVKKEEVYKLPKCCQEALARRLTVCPVCKQIFMNFNQGNERC